MFHQERIDGPGWQWEPALIDLPDAIKNNQRTARLIGWGDYRHLIVKLLRLPAGKPDEEEFALAIAHWQYENKLKVTGVIDATSWRFLLHQFLPDETRFPAQVTQQMVRRALREWRRWQRGKIKGTNPLITKVLQHYFTVGVGRTVGARKLRSQEWHRANCWNSVFMSYLLRTSGAGPRFPYSRTALPLLKAAMFQGQRPGAGPPVELIRSPPSLQPQLGDLLYRWTTPHCPPPRDLTKLRGSLPVELSLVVEVNEKAIQVIGGGIWDDFYGGNTVGRQKLMLNPRGELASPECFLGLLRLEG